MRFVETPVFTESLQDTLSDDEYRALQLALVLRPEQGAIIRGSGGLRKIRWAAGRRGKRGGVRVIYHWDPLNERVFMLFIYRKTDQDDLTANQLRVLRRLVSEELR